MNQPSRLISNVIAFGFGLLARLRLVLFFVRCEDPGLSWRDCVERDCGGTGPLRLLGCFSISVGLGLLVLLFAALLHVTQETLMIVLILIPASAGLIDSLFVRPFLRKFCGSGNVRLHSPLVEKIKEFTATLTTTTLAAEIKPPRLNLAS